MNKIQFLLIILLIAFAGCSKAPGKTDAKVKINLANFTSALENNVGAGGGILFGKSISNGEQFGKLLSGSEDNIELANGDWVFYAIMWEAPAGTIGNLAGTAYCGKSSQKLAGKAINISMSLNNSNCSDSEFGQSYVDPASEKVRFAKFYMEECDSLSKAGSTGCGGSNQGSAGSYQLIFQSYTKEANGKIELTGAPLRAACTSMNEMMTGLNSNFPTSSAAMRFTVSVEMFLGNESCTADAKGSYVYDFKKGLAMATSGENTSIPFLGNTCVQNFTTTIEETCTLNFGVYDRSTGLCTTASYPPIAQDFLPSSMCQSGSSTTSRVAIKQLVAIPKSAICDKYSGKSEAMGANPFAAGMGTEIRPYRICNEWQFNQISEIDSPIDYGTSASYKLANDLDMNLASAAVATYLKPKCAGLGGIDQYANFNPIGGTRATDCIAAVTAVGYDGTFDGAGYTIKNIRAEFKSQDYMGLFRKLKYGTIKNLSLQNIEMAGKDYVGGLVGKVSGTTARVANVNINYSRIKGEQFVGGAIGTSYTSATVLYKIRITNGLVRGDNFVGGLVGDNYSAITQSYFRGDIKAENRKTIAASSYSGGLVGVNEGTGYISEAFSEGTFDSQTEYTGGLVGNNQGAISSSYSTMIIGVSNTRQDGTNDVTVGGIAGKTIANSISNVYFDGSYKALPNADIDNFFDAAISYGVSGCKSGYYCYGPDTIPYASLRSGTLAPFNSGVWTAVAGSIPRLSWEVGERECLDLSNQLAFEDQPSGKYVRGSLLLPFSICNAAQLRALSTASISTINNNSKYFKILDDVNLLAYSQTSSSAIVDNLYGNILGNDHILYNLVNLTSVGSTPPNVNNGIFGVINAGSVVSNLTLASNILDSIPDDSTRKFGILAGTNSGFVNNIKMFNNDLAAAADSGLLVGVNQGHIMNVSSSRGSVKGKDYRIGGLVGVNDTGAKMGILEVDTSVVDAGTGSVTNMGGIVGVNKSSLDQAKFSGQLISTNYPPSNVGGISGINSGTISNVFSSNESLIQVKGNNGIGGLVGKMDGGSIETSFNLAKIFFHSGSVVLDTNPMDADTRLSGPAIGIRAAVAVIKPSLYYLNNTVAKHFTSLVVSTCEPGEAILSALVPTGAGKAVSLGQGPLNFFDTNYTSPIPFVLSYANLPECGSFVEVGFVDLKANYDEYGLGKTPASFSNFNSYCSTFSGPSGSETCSDTNGFDIASMTFGQNRLINYYLAKMNYTALPSDTPIWELSDGDVNPKLVRLNN